LFPVVLTRSIYYIYKKNMKIFIQAKHWQIFIILFILPVAIETMLLNLLLPAGYVSSPMIYFSVIMVIYTIVYFGWLYTLGINLCRKLPASVKTRKGLFKNMLIIPFVYILFTTLFLQYTFTLESLPIFIPAVVFPVHIAVMFCLFYSFWFIARNLKAVEKQVPVNPCEYTGDFLLIWLFPVGIWIIQPRINRIFKE